MNDHKDKNIPNGRTDNSIGNNYFIKKRFYTTMKLLLMVLTENPAKS
jgi:hypothetical protein